MRRKKVMLGVEGPSFFEYQKKKKEEAQPEAPKKKDPMEAIFGGKPEAGPGTPVPPAAQTSRESRMRPGFQGQSSYWSDPEQWFEVRKLWDYVAGMRSQYHVRTFPVTVLTMSAVDPRYNVVDMNVAVAQIAQFFGLPVSTFQGLTLQDAWTHVFDPFLNGIARAMNNAKPYLVPGYLKFDMDDTGALMIVYQEH